MTNSGKSRLVTLGMILLFAVYAPTALWLKNSYVPLERPKGAILRLVVFEKSAPDGFAYLSRIQTPNALADSPANPQHSPAVIFEDERPLGPAHSSQQDIQRIGHGRFSHVKDLGYLFSTSDNSNPKTNGRSYWIVLPDAGSDSLRR